MTLYVHGGLYGPHDPPLPLSERDMRALDHAAQRTEAFDAYRCGAHHLTLTTPDFGVPTCELCEGESLPPALIGKWRGKVRARAADAIKAWRRIGTCEDEFGPDSPACGEYRDVLDARMVELKHALELAGRQTERAG